MKFCRISQKDYVMLASSSSDQEIYSVAGNIVFCSFANSANWLFSLQKNIKGKSFGAKSLAEIAAKNNPPGEMIVAGKDFFGLNAYRVSGFSAKYKLSANGSEEPLETLAKLYSKGCQYLQIGIATKNGARTILAPKFFANEKYGDASSKTFELLSEYFSNTSKEQKNVSEIIEHLKQYACSANFLDNIEYRIKTKLLQQKLNNKNNRNNKNSRFSVFRKSKPSGSIDEILEKFADFQKNQSRHKLIIGIKKPLSISQSGYYDMKQETLNFLMNELGVSGHAFRYADYLGLTCEHSESQRIINMLKSKASRYFSGKNRLLESIASARKAYPIFTPELAMAIRQRMKGGIGVIARPIVSRKADLWNLEDINAYQAHEITTGENSTVAIIDTGVDYSHSELADRFGEIKGYNFIDELAEPYDGNSHGTHVAGTVAGRTTGVAPSATLIALKVLTDEGFGSEYDSNRALEFCIDPSKYLNKNAGMKVDAANMSLGCPVRSDVEETLTRIAAEKGIIIAAAAGNEEVGYSYPAAYEKVVAVAAVDRNNNHANFSNIADTNDVSAPGVNIYSSLPGNDYGLLTGTSMATPHIAGAAALAKSLSKSIDVEDFRELIGRTSIYLGDRDEFGEGLIQLDELVKNI